jgi:selenocysteine-specific elongation factor
VEARPHGLILATAGHIDHGKTALVRALTGVDTDRLPAEKARGISIDLGFAHLSVPGGGHVAFVDVPGHERFLRNMLAGVGAAGAALLVVAADDGPKPQTVEHLEILDLLGIPGAAIAITKCDRVPAARIEAVRRQVAALVAGTTLDGAGMIETALPEGRGIPALREALRAALRPRPAAEEPFRFALDRAFSVAGIGTVVTGTVLRGRVRPGDELLLSPAGKLARVRGLQIAGMKADAAAAGERCALNLAGLDHGEVRRGDWLLPPALHRPTTRLDVELRVAALGEDALRHWSPGVLHLGAAAIPARVRLRRGASLRAGMRGLGQLVLDAPVAALHGERFILRDAAGGRTLAGGRILDPFAPVRARPGRDADLQALADPDADVALAALLRSRPEGVDPAPFAAGRNLDEAAFAELLGRADGIALGRPAVCLARREVEALRARILAQPGDGIVVEALRRDVAPSLPLRAFLAILRGLAEQGLVDIAGGVLRRPEAARAAAGARLDQRRALLRALQDQGPEGVPATAVPGLLRAPPAFLRAQLEALRRDGLAHLVAGRWHVAAAMDRFAAVAARLAEAQAEGFSAAQFRDAAGIGRNRAIEILEYLDTLGITRREGAVRRLARRAPCPLGVPHER